MDADDFFSRWSRRAAERKASQAQSPEPSEGNMPAALPESSRAAATPAKPQEPVTLDDVSALTGDSDYSPFVAKGVDELVKRSAMKKLFADPHFNVMDGLDIYIDDYSVFEPIKPAVLHALNHAKPLLDPLKQVQSSMLSLMQEGDQQENPASESQETVTQPAAEEDAAEPVAERDALPQEGGSGMQAARAAIQPPDDISDPTMPAETAGTHKRHL